jgi:predicted MPP superfamily phosphohydrolase
MRLVWATDIHLNFVDARGADRFYASLEATRADGVLVGGDIAEAKDLVGWLRALDARLQRPIYFVLGNHDYYGAFVDETRRQVASLVKGHRRLRWLNLEQPIPLSPRTGLIGHDGWGDARLGDFARSLVQLTDFRRIRDLIGLDKASLGEKLRAFGEQAAADVRRVLPEALDRFEELIFLTHVPPFKEACWHEGRISADDWLPFFTCGAVGDVLGEAMKARPDRRMTVLCGHTHGAGEARLLPNLVVRTGGADYGKPGPQSPLVEVA